jgi:hypothetical protein
MQLEARWSTDTDVHENVPYDLLRHLLAEQRPGIILPRCMSAPQACRAVEWLATRFPSVTITVGDRPYTTEVSRYARRGWTTNDPDGARKYTKFALDIGASLSPQDATTVLPVAIAMPAPRYRSVERLYPCALLDEIVNGDTPRAKEWRSVLASYRLNNVRVYLHHDGAGMPRNLNKALDGVILPFGSQAATEAAKAQGLDVQWRSLLDVPVPGW